MLIASTVTRNVGVIIAVVVTIGFVVVVWSNLRKARPEIGSEIELAANRKPYYDDDELEGKKLDRTLAMGLGLLVVIVVALPAYWLQEPGRQEGSVAYYDKKFVGWGARLFASTAEGGFNCAGCHGNGGVGGVAPYTVTDGRTGEVRQVNWAAPALTTALLKYREDEIRTILVYGRPFSPMSPWGVAGGGPMNDQQIQTLIEYMRSIQVCDPSQPGLCQPVNDKITEEITKQRKAAEDAGRTFDEGEALFNLALDGGAYNCARCHTEGWSYGDPQAAGGGAYGPALAGGVTPRHFATVEDQIAFVRQPPGYGKRYGTQNQQLKVMPGFGRVYTDEQLAAVVDYVRSL